MKVNATINRLIDKPDSSVKAIASASFDGYYAVHGIKVCSGEKGLFISTPSTSFINSSGEKNYQGTFHPITKGAREALHSAVIRAYKLAISQSQQAEIEVQDTPDEDESEEPVYDEPDPDPVMSM